MISYEAKIIRDQSKIIIIRFKKKTSIFNLKLPFDNHVQVQFLMMSVLNVFHYQL